MLGGIQGFGDPEAVCRPQAELGPLPWQCTHFENRGQAQSLLSKRGCLTGGHGHCPQGHSSPQRLLTSGPWAFQAGRTHQRLWGYRGSQSSGQATPLDEACLGWDNCKLQCHWLLSLCCPLSGPGTSLPFQPGLPDAPGSRGLFPRTHTSPCKLASPLRTPGGPAAPLLRLGALGKRNEGERSCGPGTTGLITSTQSSPPLEIVYFSNFPFNIFWPSVTSANRNLGK